LEAARLNLVDLPDQSAGATLRLDGSKSLIAEADKGSIEFFAAVPQTLI
jgi:hypothetical protein